MTLFLFQTAGTEKTEKPIQKRDSTIAMGEYPKTIFGKRGILSFIGEALPSGTREKLESEIQGAPVKVLEGADMPAILIELGYLTNPPRRKRCVKAMFAGFWQKDCPWYRRLL
jgi:hypothetical protein